MNKEILGIESIEKLLSYSTIITYKSNMVELIEESRRVIPARNIWEVYAFEENEQNLIFRQGDLDGSALSLFLSRYTSRLTPKLIIKLYGEQYDKQLTGRELFIRETPYKYDGKYIDLIKDSESLRCFNRSELFPIYNLEEKKVSEHERKMLHVINEFVKSQD